MFGTWWTWHPYSGYDLIYLAFWLGNWELTGSLQYASMSPSPFWIHCLGGTGRHGKPEKLQGEAVAFGAELFPERCRWQTWYYQDLHHRRGPVWWESENAAVLLMGILWNRRSWRILRSFIHKCLAWRINDDRLVYILFCSCEPSCLRLGLHGARKRFKPVQRGLLIWKVAIYVFRCW